MKALERAIDRPLPILLAAVLVVSRGFWCLARLPIKRAPGVEIPFEIVETTSPPARSAPAVSQTPAIISAPTLARALLPTAGPILLATSLAPIFMAI